MTPNEVALASEDGSDWINVEDDQLSFPRTISFSMVFRS